MWLYYKFFYNAQSWDSHKIPATGGVLLICNHQSYLDLPLLGIGISHRHFYSFARATLFSHPIFSAYIRSLNAFPVDQHNQDIKGLRIAIDALKREQMLLIFPEGRRTSDGALHDFQDGVRLLIRRAKPVVVPAALEGPFDIWPITEKWPKAYGHMGVMFGDPIEADFLLAMDPQEASAHLQRRVEILRLKIRARLQEQTHGAFPPPGPNDQPGVPLDGSD
jgi:1-acyl-sn-glycerol-3-phosphate acyltransferase